MSLHTTLPPPIPSRNGLNGCPTPSNASASSSLPSSAQSLSDRLPPVVGLKGKAKDLSSCDDPQLQTGQAHFGGGVNPIAHSSRQDGLFYRNYRSEEEDLPGIMRLVEVELSEPYNHYTFRYFLMDWPHLTFLVYPDRTSSEPIATIISKQDSHRGKTNRGYIAMLSVERAWRRKGIASKLVKMVIEEMTRRGAHEVVLETEYDNESSLRLYDSLGFLREKRLHRFYSNGKDAFRLILPLPSIRPQPPESPEEADRGRWAVASGPELLEGQEPWRTESSEITDEDRLFPSYETRADTPTVSSLPRPEYDYYI